jgi:hypothetical protein
MRSLNLNNVCWLNGMFPLLAIVLTLTVSGTSWCQEPLFGARVSISVGDGPCDVAVGDFDEDGHMDIAVSLQYPAANNIVVLLGNGDGTYTAGRQPRGLATGDFNGDGHLHLAVTNPGSNNVSVLRGNGNGTFQPAINLAADTMPLSIMELVSSREVLPQPTLTETVGWILSQPIHPDWVSRSSLGGAMEPSRMLRTQACPVHRGSLRQQISITMGIPT